MAFSRRRATTFGDPRHEAIEALRIAERVKAIERAGTMQVAQSVVSRAVPPAASHAPS
jgi:hypothetical protein